AVVRAGLHRHVDGLPGTPALLRQDHGAPRRRLRGRAQDRAAPGSVAGTRGRRLRRSVPQPVQWSTASAGRVRRTGRDAGSRRHGGSRPGGHGHGHRAAPLAVTQAPPLGPLLPASFYRRTADRVAPDLVGKWLVVTAPGGAGDQELVTRSGRIVETEA